MVCLEVLQHRLRRYHRRVGSHTDTAAQLDEQGSLPVDGLGDTARQRSDQQRGGGAHLGSPGTQRPVVGRRHGRRELDLAGEQRVCLLDTVVEVERDMQRPPCGVRRGEEMCLGGHTHSEAAKEVGKAPLVQATLHAAEDIAVAVTNRLPAALVDRPSRDAGRGSMAVGQEIAMELVPERQARRRVRRDTSPSQKSQRRRHPTTIGSTRREGEPQ